MVSENSNHYDILICGAGLVGISLALALSPLPLRIALCEAYPFKVENKPDSDGRSLALTYASSQILRAIGVWPAINSQASPIETVHISRRGRFGKTHIHAKDENVPALGYVVPAMTLISLLNQALLKAAQDSAQRLTLFSSSKVDHMEKIEQGWKISLNTEQGQQIVTAKLIIGADGTHSTIRKLQNIAIEEKDYQQSAIATAVTLSHLHHNSAYERFTNDGVLALLPLADGRCALIWTADNEKIQALNSLPEATFLQSAQREFGYRLGKLLQVGKRHVYPLKMLLAKEQVREGLVLIGNAAHTLHPIAAQGLNLGLADVALLAQIIATTVRAGKELGSLTTLREYEKQRIANQEKIMRFTDKLTYTFAQDFFPVGFLQSSGLVALDILTPLKHRLARRLMGMEGRLTNLLKGLPL